MDIFRIEETEDKIITIRDCPVLIDRDVAGLYGVATKEINLAVPNNPEKFPNGYVIELTDNEIQYKTLIQKSGEIIAEVLADDLETTDTETTVELNVAFLKIKRTVKKKKGGKNEE